MELNAIWTVTRLSLASETTNFWQNNQKMAIIHWSPILT